MDPRTVFDDQGWPEGRDFPCRASFKARCITLPSDELSLTMGRCPFRNIYLGKNHKVWFQLQLDFDLMSFHGYPIFWSHSTCEAHRACLKLSRTLRRVISTGMVPVIRCYKLEVDYSATFFQGWTPSSFPHPVWFIISLSQWDIWVGLRRGIQLKAISRGTWLWINMNCGIEWDPTFREIHAICNVPFVINVAMDNSIYRGSSQL